MSIYLDYLEGMTKHKIERMRHELRRRTLTISEIAELTPHMRRIRFVSPELHDFVSASADDHVKLFFAPSDGGDPVMRDFTPRLFDTTAGWLVIDFALHDAGPAAEWAMAAVIGNTLEIGGPRGSAVIPDDFDWYWLIGDASALPAIGRRLEELRAGVPVTSLVVLGDAADAQQIDTRADWTPVWLAPDERPDAQRLTEALASMALPAGDGFVWIAGETRLARAARAHVIDRGHPKEWLKASGYWSRGEADSHGNIED